MQRYQIQMLPTEPTYVIYDNELDGYCTLRTEGDNLLPLEWRSREGAEAWLWKCRALWAARTVPAPRGWRSWTPPLVSPWLIDTRRYPPRP